jgi:hypothetical protein
MSCLHYDWSRRCITSLATCLTIQGSDKAELSFQRVEKNRIQAAAELDRGFLPRSCTKRVACMCKRHIDKGSNAPHGIAISCGRYLMRRPNTKLIEGYNTVPKPLVRSPYVCMCHRKPHLQALLRHLGHRSQASPAKCTHQRRRGSLSPTKLEGEFFTSSSSCSS